MPLADSGPGVQNWLLFNSISEYANPRHLCEGEKQGLRDNSHVGAKFAHIEYNTVS